jgi:hypothetical protein
VITAGWKRITGTKQNTDELLGHHRITHVLVNQPDTGYGIFIENMLQAAE